MKSHRKIATSLLLAAGAGSYVQAQSSDVPIRYFRPLNNTVSVGMRLTNSSSSVKFSNLGSIQRSIPNYSTALNSAEQSRSYDNGTVSSDQKVGDVATNASGVSAVDNVSVYVYNERPKIDGTGTAGYDTTQLNPITSEGLMAVTVLSYKKVKNDDGTVKTETYTDSAGATQTRVVYEKDSNGNLIEEAVIGGYYVPHNENATRYWNGRDDSQYVRDEQGRIIGVNMDIYGAVSNGASAEATPQSGTGFELSFERTIRRVSPRFEWGFKGTLGVSGVNAKTEKTITADLITLRATYLTTASFPYIPDNYIIDAARRYTTVPAQYNTSGTDSSGSTVIVSTIDKETTIPLSAMPIATADGSYTTVLRDANKAEIKGFWQIKGAYYMVRLGPSARFYFSPRFSVSATAGLGVAYYSSRFRIDETLQSSAYATGTIAFRTDDLLAANGRDPYDNSKKGVTFGPVGEINAELWLTARTGFYAGVAYEKLGKFTHQIGQQKADIELGTGTTIRFGINTRF